MMLEARHSVAASDFLTGDHQDLSFYDSHFSRI